MIDQLIQGVIALSSLLAVALLLHPNKKLGRIGAGIGIAGQPFYLYFAWTAGAWGLFIAAVGWSLLWGYAIWKTWIEPKEAV